MNIRLYDIDGELIGDAKIMDPGDREVRVLDWQGRTFFCLRDGNNMAAYETNIIAILEVTP